MVGLGLVAAALPPAGARERGTAARLKDYLGFRLDQVAEEPELARLLPARLRLVAKLDLLGSSFLQAAQRVA